MPMQILLAFLYAGLSFAAGRFAPGAWSAWMVVPVSLLFGFCSGRPRFVGLVAVFVTLLLPWAFLVFIGLPVYRTVGSFLGAMARIYATPGMAYGLVWFAPILAALAGLWLRGRLRAPSV